MELGQPGAVTFFAQTPPMDTLRWSLMVEGAVHHLDILADLAGAPCDTLYAQTWNSTWSGYAGDSQGLVMMRMSNGMRALYEGAKANAVGLNGWGQQYIRAECEKATLIMDQRRIEVFPYSPDIEQLDAREDQGQALPLLEQTRWSHAWLIEQFCDCLAGGPAMETSVEKNL